MANVLDRIFRRTAAEVPVSSPWSTRETIVATTFASLFDLEYIPVTRSTGMGIGVLAKGRHLITTVVGGFPIVGMRGNEAMADQPLICRQPEPGRPRSVTITWAMDAMYWYGRVWYVVVDRYPEAEGGRPRRVRWVPEWEAEIDPQGRLVKAFAAAVEQRDVIRVDGPHEGLLNFATGLIREAIAIEAAAANAADNPVPSIDLHQVGGNPLGDTEIDALTARWVASRKKKGGGVGYTNANIEAKVLGQPVEQLLIAARQQSDLNLIRAAGLPAWAGDVPIEGSNITYSNSPSRTRELLDLSADAYMRAWADRFSMDDILPAGQWCLFDTTGILRGNFKERMEGYKAAIDAGIYTADQCRLLEAGLALEGV
jgi:hypothetical protein